MFPVDQVKEFQVFLKSQKHEKEVAARKDKRKTATPEATQTELDKPEALHDRDGFNDSYEDDAKTTPKIQPVLD